MVKFQEQILKVIILPKIIGVVCKYFVQGRDILLVGGINFEVERILERAKCVNIGS